MSKYVTGDGWLDLQRVLSHNAEMNVIIGQRSLGKTYAAKLHALGRYARNGEQFVYIRRYGTELDGIGTLFDNVEHPLLSGKFVTAKGGKFILREIDSDSIWDDVPDEGLGSGKPKKSSTPVGETIGYYMSLSKHQTIKGTEFPKVTTIIFDEFIIENTRHFHYLPDEISALMSVYLTVARGRENVKLILLANSAKLNNPYFAEYNVSPKDFINSERCFRNKRKVFFVKLDETRVRNAVLTEIAPTEYVEYAVGNQFLDDTDDFIIPKIPVSHIVMQLCLDSLKDVFSLYATAVENAEGNRLWWICRSKHNDAIGGHFSVDSRANLPDYPYRLKSMQAMKGAWRHQVLRFDSAYTRELFAPYLNGSKYI